MLEEELMARDGWSREDILAYRRDRVPALTDTVNSSSAGAVPPLVEMEPVSALPPEPGGEFCLVRSA